MYTIRIVDPVETYPQAAVLIEANWAETGFDFPLDLDLEMYRAMVDCGMMFAIAAFDGVELVGYCAVMVVRHPFNKTVVIASNNALFVKPEYRRGLLPGRLILSAEKEAKARGASRFSWQCRAGTPLAKMLEDHGYTPVDIAVMKEL
jgi:GNAT superfamily N-acetyltransferase